MPYKRTERLRWCNLMESNKKYAFSETEYQAAFRSVLDGITKNVALKKNHAVLFLGGQPGAGKSTFYNMDNNFSDYIVINGDNYRIHHPYYRDIVRNSREQMAELTQQFINRVVEDLIAELSKDGYNLIIEGTLRDAAVPIKTGTMLKEYGYTTELYVIGCDACVSWESTISRAELMAEIEHSPRIVPLEKYNVTVNNLPGNLQKIEESGCMDKIVIINRECKILWRSDNYYSKETASKILAEVLNIEKWNADYRQYIQQYNEFVNKMKQKGK